MARASSRPHLIGWLILGILVFLQSPGLTVADTKHDLTTNPWGFLHGALHAWTDIFPLGQLQNQAYGYLFPQGLFFLLTDPLPDWIAQRLWWWLLLGLGYSGFCLLLKKAQVGAPGWQMLGSFLFALSPHTISTVGAISSETWPMMLTPWALLPIVGVRPTTRGVAGSVIAVACMGAVNATATAAACLPVFVTLLVARAWRPLALWLAGCCLVSIWWLGPLIILGRYSPPFTDFIESSYVTTRWLSLVEVLRGTTSWAPFADSERIAGTVLATSPYFVLLTVAVAVLGLAGLALARQRLWIIMLLCGVVIMGSAHGPFGGQVLAFLDGMGAPLRNVHKFDVLVRVPLVIGFVHAASSLRLADAGRRKTATALLCLLAVSSLAPAWSGRLAPRGGFEQVPGYWHEAAAWLNENAAGTRTVILPQSSFARQDWGWTRDEPLQPLLGVPWVVRDAVPLIPPEAIRGLDGLMAHPTPDGFARLGIGAAVIRHDLIGSTGSRALSDSFKKQGLPVHSFGEVDIVEFNLSHSMHLVTGTQKVAGGGESLALLDPGAYDLVASDATVVTDTPQLVSRNYGTVWNAQSAPLASPDEGDDVRNKVRDYPSRGPLATVSPNPISVSSSAADATAFGGANPARSATAAVDGSLDTAWFPAPGHQEGETLTIREPATDPVLEIVTTGAPVVLTISSDSTTLHRFARPGQKLRVELAGETSSLTITLGASASPAGLADVRLLGHDISRVLEVPNTSPEVQKFLFQRVFVDTDLIQRRFTAPRDMTVTVNASSCDEDPRTANPSGVTDDFLLDSSPLSCGDSVTLPAGMHELSTTASWITLTTPDYAPPPAPLPISRDVPPASEDRILVTGRAYNEGLRATVGGVDVAPQLIDADTQAFLIPAGVHGPVSLAFTGDRPYRASLFGGLFAAVVTVIGCLWWRRRGDVQVPLRPTGFPVVFGAVALGLVGGMWAIIAAALAWVILRFTLVTRPALAALGVGLAGLWLAHAPWPSASYAGDQWFVTLACCVSLTALVLPDGRHPPQ